MILYAGYDEGQEVHDIEIYTARLDGSHRRKLTDNESMDGFPNWSPDAK
ncbi:MAG: hypothetical protein HUJ26_16090 [Planctomycetaceae bacterium]|nr:hypothetical protein [Planctomycetaceae bacterium]